MKQGVTFEVFYPHPPERIWRALTDPVALARWLMPADFRPRLGHRFRFREPKSGPGKGASTGTVCCEVVTLEEPRRLAYTWQSERDSEPTLVSWTLEPVEGGTRLQLEHVQLEPIQREHVALETPSSLVFRSEAQANWNVALSSALPVVLERGRVAVRQRGSIVLAGAAQPVRCVCRERPLCANSIGAKTNRREQIHGNHR